MISLTLLAVAALILLPVPALAERVGEDDVLTYVWPLPEEFSSGNGTLSVDPGLSLVVEGDGGGSTIVRDAFDRYRKIIFQHDDVFSIFNAIRRKKSGFDINKLRVSFIPRTRVFNLVWMRVTVCWCRTRTGSRISGEATIEANSVYGALHELETFSQICAFDFGTKSVLVKKAP